MASSAAPALPGDAPAYERHRPEQTPLYALVEEHFPRFLERLDAEGVSLPHFVIEEFEAYIEKILNNLAARETGGSAARSARSLIEKILTHLAARETGGINPPRAPPLHAPLTQPPASPSPALS